MKFNDNGTASVDIDGTTYTLRRPTLGQLWDFYELRDQLLKESQERIRGEIEALRDLDDDSAEFIERNKALQDRRYAFTYLTEPWLRVAFDELGSKPLPENLDNAPSDFADLTLPNQLLDFWRDTPLAHSSRGRANPLTPG